MSWEHLKLCSKEIKQILSIKMTGFFKDLIRLISESFPFAYWHGSFISYNSTIKCPTGRDFSVMALINDKEEFETAQIKEFAAIGDPSYLTLVNVLSLSVNAEPSHMSLDSIFSIESNSKFEYI